MGATGCSRFRNTKKKRGNVYDSLPLPASHHRALTYDVAALGKGVGLHEVEALVLAGLHPAHTRLLHEQAGCMLDENLHLISDALQVVRAGDWRQLALVLLRCTTRRVLGPPAALQVVGKTMVATGAHAPGAGYPLGVAPAVTHPGRVERAASVVSTKVRW